MLWIIVVLVIFVLAILFLYLFFLPAITVNDGITATQLQYMANMEANRDHINAVLTNRPYAPFELLPQINLNANLGHLNQTLLCFQTPIRVSSDRQENYNCALACGHPQAQYFFVEETDVFVVNGDVLQSGGYCTTSTIPENCNRETSIVLFSNNQWTCIAEDPRYFAGMANAQQVAGRQHPQLIRPGTEQNNVLIDRLLAHEVDVSRNTFRQSWDELMEDGTRRFVVVCNALDRNNNLMFVNPLNPIECLPNVCTNVSNVHGDVKPNFATGECDCGDYLVTRVTHVDANDPSSICASIVNTFDEETNTYTFRRDCLLPFDPVTKLDTARVFCPPGIFNAQTDGAYSVQLRGVQAQDPALSVHDFTNRQYLELKERIDFRFTYDKNRPNFGENFTMS
jgi:hypothetical protein